MEASRERRDEFSGDDAPSSFSPAERDRFDGRGGLLAAGETAYTDGVGPAPAGAPGTRRTEVG